MTPVRLPVTKVAELYAALTAAMEHASNTGGGALWRDLCTARSFVRVYMLDEAQPVEAELTQREAA